MRGQRVARSSYGIWGLEGRRILRGERRIFIVLVMRHLLGTKLRKQCRESSWAIARMKHFGVRQS